ncbi:hypothetical protein HanRHA438_Chr16g0786431 [Helianthus annuus]|nr:hypothetical protein HanIR_Chr16g0842251 [Helianthus annuus]KAJ0838201.1 hypothetical protein HanRHA438_Chr16g0786431 [Helianthus annuus]
MEKNHGITSGFNFRKLRHNFRKLRHNRRLSVRQLKATINIFNHQNRPVRCSQQQVLQTRITSNTRQLQVVNIKLHVISYSSYQTRLPGPRRTIQQVPSLPHFPHSFIKLLPLHKQIQIINNRLLHLRIHRQRLKRRRMVQIHRFYVPAWSAPVRRRLQLDIFSLRGPDVVAVVIEVAAVTTASSATPVLLLLTDVCPCHRNSFVRVRYRL